MAPHPDLLHLSRAVPDWVLRAAMIVSHSYGAVVGVNAVRATPGHYRGFVACDPSFAHPDLWAEQQPRVDGPELSRPGRVYPDLQTALSRFKLAPPQESVEPALEEYIAIHSVRPCSAEQRPMRWRRDRRIRSPWWVSRTRTTTSWRISR